MDIKLVMIVLIVVLLIYLLWRLRNLEELVRRTHFKNDEGVGSLSRTRNPLYFLLAVICFLPTLISWLMNGFTPISFYGLIPVAFFLWLACNGDDDE